MSLSPLTPPGRERSNGRGLVGCVELQAATKILSESYGLPSSRTEVETQAI